MDLDPTEMSGEEYRRLKLEQERTEMFSEALQPKKTLLQRFREFWNSESMANDR